MAPWMVMALIAVVAFLGLGFARTSLDGSAFDLARLDRAIAEQTALNRQLNLEIAKLENPARISPLAEELGLVIPLETNQILVDLDTASPMVAERAGDGANQ
jgi:cell division protein FtsL